MDHLRCLGNTVVVIAPEKAGIIKPDSFAVLAQELAEAAEMLLAAPSRWARPWPERASSSG